MPRGEEARRNGFAGKNEEYFILLEGSLVMKGNNYECILFNDG
jgi:hypothetical protein